MNFSQLEIRLELLEAKIDERTDSLLTSITIVWFLTTGIGIMIMQVGFAMLETGAIGAKNIKGTMLKNISDSAIGAVVWVLFGWGLYTGNDVFAAGDGATFIHNHQPQDFARMFQQYGFAATATTLVSGAILGRCKFWIYLVFAAFMTGIFYPIVAHWAWNPNGWLAQMGFLDFAGGAVVHAFGGATAIVASIICGPRAGRFILASEDDTTSVNTSNSSIAYLVMKIQEFTQNICRICLPAIEIISGDSKRLRKVRDMPAYSPVIFSIGGFFLWIGWFSFNACSVLSMDEVSALIASRAAINTLLAAGSGTLFGILFCFVLKTRLDLNTVVNSMLTSTVVVTPSCGYIELWVAIFVGPLSVLIFTLFRFLVLHVFGIDDPLDVFAVHGSGGMVGTIILGLLHPQKGLFYVGDASFFGIQILGTIVIMLTGATFSLLYFLFAKYTVGVHYSSDEQFAELDFLHFELESQSDLDWVNVQEYNVREKFKRELRAKRIQIKEKHLVYGQGEVSPADSADIENELK